MVPGRELKTEMRVQWGMVVWDGVATKAWSLSPGGGSQVGGAPEAKRLLWVDRRSLGSWLSAWGKSPLGVAKWVTGASCMVLKCQSLKSVRGSLGEDIREEPSDEME